MPEIHNLIARDLVSRLMTEGGTWDRYTNLYNNTIAPYNLMAVSAALDAVDALSETPLYRQQLKKHLNQAQAIGERYSRLLKVTYGDKHTLFIDYCMRFASSLDAAVTELRKAVGLRLAKLNVTTYAYHKTLLLAAVHMADNAAELHAGYLRICRGTGVNRDALLAFDYADMRPLERRLQAAAQILIPLTAEQSDAYNHDAGISEASDNILRPLLDDDGEVDFMRLGRFTVDACNLDRERWGEAGDKAQRDLDAIQRLHDEQQAQKDAEAYAERLGEKYKTRRRKAKKTGSSRRNRGLSE